LNILHILCNVPNRCPSQAGLKGCGISLAIGLSRSGLGSSLLRATQERDEFGLRSFLEGWREQLRNVLRTNSDGYLGRKYPILADSVPDSFPNPVILSAYANPLTSWSSGGSGPQIANLHSQVPDITRIASFCNRKFGWGRSHILQRFNNLLWDGVCLTMLIAVRAQIRPCKDSLRIIGYPQSVSTGQEQFSCLAPIRIRKHKQCPKPGDSVALYHVDFSTATLAHSALAGVQPPFAASDPAPSVNDADSSSAWIPGPVLALALPEVWCEFVRKKGALALPLHPPQVRSFVLVPCT
jgi:holliday junction resolvase YEN1